MLYRLEPAGTPNSRSFGSFPKLQTKCTVSVKYFKWQDFTKVLLKMGVMRRISLCFSGKDSNWMQKFLNGKKLNFSSSHYLCHIKFPKELTFKLVLYGFTKGWKPESKQLSSRTPRVKNLRKYQHASNGPNTQDSC